MLEFLNQIKNEKFDVMYFIAGDKDDSIEIQLRQFKESEEFVRGTELGSYYQILLYKHDKDGTCILPDKFEAILIDPLEYVSGLIPQDWFGVIAKKTKNSHKIIDNLFDKMINV